MIDKAKRHRMLSCQGPDLQVLHIVTSLIFIWYVILAFPYKSIYGYIFKEHRESLTRSLCDAYKDSEVCQRSQHERTQKMEMVFVHIYSYITFYFLKKRFNIIKHILFLQCHHCHPQRAFLNSRMSCERIQLLLPPLPFRKNIYFYFLKKIWDTISKDLANIVMEMTLVLYIIEVTVLVQFGYMLLETFCSK